MATLKEKAKTAGKKISDLAVANEIEAKKGAAKAKRTVKKKLEEAAAPVAEKLEETKLADQMARGRKKAQGDRKKTETRAKAESVKTAVKTPARKVAAAKLKINIQSPMGGIITPEEVAAKVPKGAKEVYIRVDENRIYWVGPKDSGSVEIWE